jgi:Zn-dependent peptidase ImmA (M78 family)
VAKDNVFAVVERHWDRAPVDIISIIRELGIIYQEERFLTNDSAFIDRIGEAYRIVVNSSHPHTRQRFSAAHELGHYTYHRDLIGTGIGDSIAYRSSNAGRYRNAAITPRMESQANQFAATVLMPSKLIKQLEQEQGIHLPMEWPRLAHMLNVSEEALRIRLGIKVPSDRLISWIFR